MSSENPSFLHQKFAGLNTSPEVESAARRSKRQSRKELPPQQPEARIQNYLERLKAVLSPSPSETDPDFDRRSRNMEMLKRSLHERFVIHGEDIPESYFDSIKRRHRDEGHGDIEIPDEYRKELGQTIIGDQEKSLDNWVDYLASDDAKYPDWLKYYAMRSVLRMGRYDKKKKAFTERTGGTINPFPDLNREALAIVLDSFERQSRGEPPKFGYDIQDDTKRSFLDFLNKKNFAKLYAVAVEEFKPIPDELLKVTDGKWVKYPRGSDHQLLVQAISAYGTGWCLRGEAMAERYLARDQNDLHIYFSHDKTGEPTVPRAVMVINAANKITEVRGVAPEENLDPYIGGVVQQKLGEFPDGTAYEKKAGDMKCLTAIEKKAKQKQAFNKEDLIFLYEMDASIEGFGYQRDPRIKELRSQRNPQVDMLVIFECEQKQIARSPQEVNEFTRAYIGPLFPGIFKVVGHLEHIYTAFPEGRIIQYNIEIGGQTEEQLEAALERAGFKISDYARHMMKPKEFKTAKDPEQADLVRLQVGDLFGDQDVHTTDDIYEKADELGLELCPAEVGPHLRLKLKDQPMGEWFHIAMKQIAGPPDGSLFVFYLERYDGGLWLSGHWARPTDEWSEGQVRLPSPQVILKNFVTF